MAQQLDIKRVAKIVDWLIFDEKIKNRRELAEKLGYTESSFSQIINGKVNLSEKFIKKLAVFDSRINFDWLITGEGEMLKDTSVTANASEVSGNNNSVVNQSISENNGQNAGRDINNYGEQKFMSELAAQRVLAERQLEVYASSLNQKDEQIRVAQSQIDTLIKQNQEQFNRFMSLLEAMQRT